MALKKKKRVLDAPSLLEEFRSLLGQNLLQAGLRERRGGGELQAQDLWVELSPRGLRLFAVALFEYDAPAFHAMSSQPLPEGLELRYHLSLFQRRRRGRVGIALIVQLLKTDLRLPTLSDLWPEAEAGELELSGQGVIFEPPDVSEKEGKERALSLGRSAARYDMELTPWHHRIPGLRVTLKLWSEKILETKLHFLPKPDIPPSEISLEKSLRFHVPAGADVLSYASALSFVRAIEDALLLEVPIRAQFLRALWGELERLQSHLFALAETCRILGLESFSQKMLELQERLPAFPETRSAGMGSFSAAVIVGGVSRDLTVSFAASLRIAMEILRREATFLRDSLLGCPLLLLRMRDIGVLPRSEAARYGATGPVARASGLRVDLRKSAPYEGYASLEVEPIVPQESLGTVRGDTYDRFAVRFLELEQSTEIVLDLLEGLPPGPLEQEGNSLPVSNEESVGWSIVEAPQGGLFYTV
ncbi:MAG: hypothetical protein GX256_10335, partial [Fretibacterium sp.]|nr:hypothetical protein [Fretibacterium sp.]